MCVIGLMLLTLFAECSLSVSQDSINTLAVTYHNTKRASEGASDMHKIEYDGGITNDAQKLADSCHYEHSVPEGQGQNLFFRSKDISVTWLQSEYGATFTSGMEGWYSEKTNYDYATNSKKTGLTSSDLIGHYKQFVLSNVKKIGCAYKVCSTLTSDSVTQTNAFYGVCNYDSVVIGSSLPFQKGTPCLLCIPGWCSNDGLCLESCTTGSTECTCPRKCSNNGLLDASKCECSCVGFWKGVTCETPNPCADDSICNSFDPANACDEILTTELEGIINIQVGNKWKGKKVSEMCPVSCNSCGAGPAGPCASSTVTCNNGGSLTIDCTCSCVNGYTGDTCNEGGSSACTKVCQNSGNLDSIKCTCSCVNSYTGDTCNEGGPSACTKVCLNGGNLDNKCTCSCVNSYTGDTCNEGGPSACTKVCLNDGNLDRNKCTCSCVNSYTGDTCNEGGPSDKKCTGVVCANGGQLIQCDCVNNCLCRCPKGWQGPKCKVSQEQVKNGVLVTLGPASYDKWLDSTIWASLKKTVSNAVNNYCKQNVAQYKICCPNSGNSLSSKTYTSTSYIETGDAYPIILKSGGLQVLVYVTPISDKNLWICDNSQKRRRRQTSAGINLPQDALFKAIDAEKGSISSDLSTCCNIAFTGVEKAVIKEPLPLPPDDGSLKVWQIALIVVGSLILVAIIVVIVVVIVKSKSNGSPKVSNSNGNAVDSSVHMTDGSYNVNRSFEE